MTAIATAFVGNSFIIGADGRRTDSKTGETTEIAQKVFCFESDQIRLAFAWTGTTQAADGNGPVWDLIAATHQNLPFAAQLAKAGFHSFISEFCNRLANTLPICMNGLPTDELARVLMVGYFQGQPFTLQVQVLYPATIRMIYPSGIHIPAQIHKTVFSGGESMYPPYADKQPQNTVEAIAFVRGYLRDCVESSNPDCAGIGGHVHIAELTPEGCKWIESPQISN